MSADPRGRPRHVVGAVVTAAALVAAGLGTAAAVLRRRSHGHQGQGGQAARPAAGAPQPALAGERVTATRARGQLLGA